MKKESLGLYLLRLSLSLALFVLMLMLYWSSNLIESDLKLLQQEMGILKRDLGEIRTGLTKVQSGIRENRLSNPTTTPNSPSQPFTSFENRPHIDPNLPNLLEEDPFYTTTLPKLLGPDFKFEGIRRSASLGRPQNLHPFTNWSEVSSWIRACTVSIARLQVGKYETFAPDMAIKVEERKDEKTGKSEFWIHFRDGVHWQPLRKDFFPQDTKLASHFLQKHQVTADDFKFYYDAMMNPYVQEPGAVALRTYYSEIESVEVVDPLTLIVRWKHEEVEEPDGKKVLKMKYQAKSLTGQLRPLARFVYQYFSDGKKILDEDSNPDTYRTNSVWAQNFSQHWAKNVIVSCGGWTFDGMTDRQIRFTRNPDHFFPFDVLVAAWEVLFKDTPDAIGQQFRANQLDAYETPSSQLIEMDRFLQSPQYEEQKQQGGAIHRLDYLARSYAWIGWNEANPLFSSKKVRQALTMAIDRKRIIRQNLNDLGIETTGTFFPKSSAYDTSITPWPYDVQRAKRLLEEEGWHDSDGDGIIDKMIDGQLRPFQFSLTYYVKSPTAKAISEYIATALKEVGISVNLNGVDIADLSLAFDDKSFDALFMMWSLGTPPEDPKQLWHSSGSKEKGSSNAIGFANAEADRIIEALQYESDPKKRMELYHRFDAIMYEEAPYTFLFTPKTVLLYRDYLQNVFIPADRQDLIPGANVSEPISDIFWIREQELN